MRKNKYYEKLIDENLVFEDEDTEPDEEDLAPYDPALSSGIVGKTSRTVMLLIAGLFLAEALIVLLLVYGNATVWDRGKWQALLGLFIGSAFAELWYLAIRRQIERIIDPGAQHVKGRLRGGAVLRMLLFIGLLAAGYFTKAMDPILLIAGAFNLKIASYLTGLLFQKNFTRPKDPAENLPDTSDASSEEEGP